MAKKTLDEIYTDIFRRDVKQGGGIWVGIQECEGLNYDLVLFNHPRTGSTLAIRTDHMCVEAVQEKLRKHAAEWLKVRGYVGSRI